MYRILIIDDESHVVSSLKRLMRQHFMDSVQVLAFTDPIEALDTAAHTPLDVAMSDFRMPTMTGLEFLAKIKQVQPNAVRLILSASYDFDIIQKAVNDVEVFRYLAKPWQDTELIKQLQLALDKAKESRQERELADAMRLQRGDLSASDVEKRRLEEQEPGITVVEWGPNGEIIMPDGLLDQGLLPNTKGSP